MIAHLYEAKSKGYSMEASHKPGRHVDNTTAVRFLMMCSNSAVKIGKARPSYKGAQKRGNQVSRQFLN